MPAPVLQFKRGNAGVAGTVPALRPGEPAISLNNFDFFIGIDTSVANNKFFGSHRYWGREDGTNSLKLKLVDKDGSNYVAIKSPDTLAGIVTYVLPGTQGGTQTVLTNDGSGNLSWSSGSLNSVFSGITTIGGSALDVNVNSDFSGITTFSNTENNVLGDENTGAVQIDGGVGIAKNLTVKENLYVGGYSEFVGVVTFKGGTINIGDSTSDDINIGGEFISGLFPNATDSYDLGDGSRKWRHAYFSGIGTFDSGIDAGNIKVGVDDANKITTTTGNIVLDPSAVGGEVIVRTDLHVDGNVTVGGTTVTLLAQDVYIQNKDIVLGYTTSYSPNDTTANHAGVAIASTEGTPLVSFSASGINTLPDTYKQLMWFQKDTLGFATDAFAFNYGVAIGTTTMANGVRLAVGSGITMSDTSISATNFYGTFNGSITGNAPSADQVKTQTASNTNATYHITFVDSNNGSATNETVYTDDGIYYNPGTNTFTTQHGYFTGNVTVDGTINGLTISAGVAATATRAVTVDTTGTSTNADYYVTFVDTLAGQNGETLRVGAGLSVNPSTGNVGVASVLSVGNTTDLNAYIKAGGGSNAMYLYGNGDVSFQAKVITNSIRSSSDSNNAISLAGRDVTLENNVKIVGITTIGTGVGVTQFSASVSTGSSTSSVPTSSAVMDYVGTQIGNIDLTLGLTADTGGPSTVNTSQTLTIAGTPSEVETSVSGQTVTIGLPNDVVVGTSLSTPTVRTNYIYSQDTNSLAVTISGNDVTIAGDLIVQGDTTQIETKTLTVEDRTIELGRITPGAQPSSTTWDLAVLFNYGDSGAKKAGLVWEASGATKRFQFTTDVNTGADGEPNDTAAPQFAVSNFAPIEVSELWVNNSCTGGAQAVITCDGGSELLLRNITVDAGTF